jgi:ribokinase
MNQDFLAIGDIVAEPFIRLPDTSGEVTCDEQGEHCKLSLPFADKIPYESMTWVPGVGNAPNAAVAAARLGVKAALMTWLGDDENGSACKESLAANGVATEYVVTETGKMTNHHFVLWYGPDRTILIKHESFDYAFPSDLPAPRVVYLSSIGKSGMAIHESLAEWLEKNPNVMLAFQPGTFQIEAGMERLARIYARTDAFFANKEEYQRILASTEEDPKKLMEIMREEGPKKVFLTDGPRGAYALSDDGAWQIGIYPDQPQAFERTGAGDAFSSTAMVALLEGKSVPEALAWGPINAMSVVQKIGAQAGLLSRDALLAHLDQAPDYQPQPL